MSPRYAIVNADDFGQSLGINHGVIRRSEARIVTSASLMVRWPAAAESRHVRPPHAATERGAGHLDFGEWAHRNQDGFACIRSWTRTTRAPFPRDHAPTRHIRASHGSPAHAYRFPPAQACWTNRAN